MPAKKTPANQRKAAIARLRKIADQALAAKQYASSLRAEAAILRLEAIDQAPPAPKPTEPSVKEAELAGELQEVRDVLHDWSGAGDDATAVEHAGLLAEQLDKMADVIFGIRFLDEGDDDESLPMVVALTRRIERLIALASGTDDDDEDPEPPVDVNE